MKKNKNNFSSKKASKSQKESVKTDESAISKLDSLDEESQGFGGWLRYVLLLLCFYPTEGESYYIQYVYMYIVLKMIMFRFLKKYLIQ